MNEKIEQAYAELSSAINAVAGCSMLSWASNPDLARLVEVMQDKAFAMDLVMDGDDE